MNGWVIGYYVYLVCGAVVGFLLWLLPKARTRKKKRDALWLTLFCWVPLWLLGVALIGPLTGHEFAYQLQNALWAVAWSLPWWPHLSAPGWILFVAAAFFAIVAFRVRRRHAMAKLGLGLIALVLWTWFAMATLPVLSRWMWVLLLVGSACNLLLRGKKLRRFRKPIVKVIGLLMLVLAALSTAWHNPAPHYNVAAVTLHIHLDSVNNGVAKMEVSPVPKA